MTKVAIIIEALESTPIDIARILYPLFADEQNPQSNRLTSPFKDIIELMLLQEQRFNTYLIHVANLNHPNPVGIQPTQETDVSSRMSLRAMTHYLKINRDQTIIRLRSLTMKEWQSKVNHEARGQITIRLLAQELVEHDIARSNQLVEMISIWRDNQRPSYGR